METITKRHNALCAPVPDFTRLKYFYGQMLGAQDFQREQDYFREKLKLHNRCLHGYGVVCGLRVQPEPIDPTCESEDDRKRAQLEKEIEAVNQQIKEASSREKPASKGKRGMPAKASAAESVEDLRARGEKLKRELEELEKKCGVEAKRTLIEVECGLAFDCEGNELVVRRPLRIDLLDALNCGPDHRGKYDSPRSLYVSLCFCEQPIDPVRPVLPDSCGASDACTYGRIRDSVHVKVRVEPPKKDERCETCCLACADHCVLLARSDGFAPGHALSPSQIHNEVRRLISLYEPTTITGISWTQGASYAPDVTDDLLTQMEVRFSREVLISTITKGVLDMWVVEGGATRRGGIYSLEVEYDLPSTPAWKTDRLRFHYAGDENIDPGDRVMITIRGGFILDECCRPINGMNTGGRTPMIPDDAYQKFKQPEKTERCISPPPGFGPWHSGVASPGGVNFESWFYVNEEAGRGYDKRRPRGRARAMEEQS